MKTYFLPGLFLLLAVAAKAQDRFLTRTGHIAFFSEAPLENIEAHNRQVTAVLDVTKGEIAYKLLMKSFEFEKAAMQDHFNTQYLHTDKFPNAQFEGTVTNLSGVNFKKDGSYPVQVAGKLTIHGVTGDVKQSGSIDVKAGALTTRAKFDIRLADYDVRVPSDFARKISQTVRIEVDCTLTPYSR